MKCMMTAGSSARLRRLASLVIVVLACLVSACENPEPAVVRGDRLWADEKVAEALDEYRLALRQGGRNEEILLRVAHGYAGIGRIDDAREHYMQLLALAPEYEDQAIHDYLILAQESHARRDWHDMAKSVEAALELRPELSVGTLAPDLARYHADLGQTQQALRFYEAALVGSPSDSIPALLFEIGDLYDGEQDYERARGYFAAYTERARYGARAAEARWRLGQASFEMAREAHKGGELVHALELLDDVLELGVPENIQDQAWFDRGEILYAIGRFDDALAAYRNVLDLNQTRGGLIVDRARSRIDQIRFGER